MDFEKIIEALPFGVTVWRAESDNIADFRLVYANSQASKDFKLELFEFVGKTLKDSFPDALSGPVGKTLPDAWMRVAMTNKPEVVTMSFHNKKDWFEIHILPLGKGNIASMYRNVTSDKLAHQKIEQALKALKISEIDFYDFKQRKSGLHKLDLPIKKTSR